MNTEKLYNIAKKADIFVYNQKISSPSIALEIYGIKAIALRRDLTGPEERTCLAHELGHHLKGALYNKETPALSRGQCEYKANKWATHKIIPIRSLYAALRKGYTEVYRLADYFGVTEEFILKAIEIYKQEGKLPI